MQREINPVGLWDVVHRKKKRLCATPYYNPHHQCGALGGAADGAATRKSGVAKCSKQFQNGVLMREILIQCVKNAGIAWIGTKNERL